MQNFVTYVIYAHKQMYTFDVACPDENDKLNMWVGQLNCCRSLPTQ
jgi:hypothetical protein